MSSILDFSVKAANKKQKPLGLSSTLHNVDLQLLNQYVNMFTICFHGQTVTKISLRHGIVKVLMQDYWFRLNQPVSTMVLETETRQPGEFILRLLRRVLSKGDIFKVGQSICHRSLWQMSLLAGFKPSLYLSDCNPARF